jgi:hypothetical protein
MGHTIQKMPVCYDSVVGELQLSFLIFSFTLATQFCIKLVVAHIHKTKCIFVHYMISLDFE